ncbi:hypothetical protein EH243_03820 [Amphritea opalescens]|uniref:Sacsin/Nov domain-containing protein n=1 Tax=Amphritea opalescens TaxID=2490544 RepID=A0A430KV25_9GAMM|nr:hypothetical protein [Amphritea opalescens]RTE67339.1 hypothetical protein EH243_03820 [Amphritea opalescens]
MAGFIQDPMQFVNLIGDNLSDRYRSGFPVIKELIQNTDDAKATQLDFGLVAGIDDAAHPLLKGPGLFLINNGEFKESDARGIRSFGLNSKADDNSSIGKFGLGMKSVFHFCEAFFFLATDGDQNYHEILNPWSGPDPENSLHTDWDNFSEEDAERIRSQLTTVTGQGEQTEASFILWLPLRKREHLRHEDGKEGWAIVSEYVGDHSTLLDFLREGDLPGQIASLLPMLGNLRDVRFWDLQQQQKEPGFSITLAADDQRRQLLQAVEASSNQQPHSPMILAGRIDYHGNEKEKSSLQFSGREAFGWNDALTAMHAHDLWPFSNVRDRYGEPKQAKDKARPHGVALFSRMPGNGKLTTQWAVFLPMDETASETVRCDGNFNFQLTLHGYFFIDAGRQGIDGQELFANTDTPTYDSDKTIKTAWNIELARLQVLPLILPALADFCQSVKVDDRGRTALTQAFADTVLWRDLQAAITQQHAWLRTLDAEGVSWKLHDSPRLVRPLPEPAVKDAGRPWQVFPALLQSSDCPIFTVDSSPRLIDPSINIQWQETELIELFRQVDMKVIFTETTLLDYLVRFCLESAGPHKNQGTVQVELQSLLRRALSTLGEKALQLNRKMIQGFVACLVEGSCLKLDNELPPVLLNRLLEVETQVLPLPTQFFDGDTRVAKSISVEDAAALLRQVDAVIRTSAGNSEALENSALKTADQILLAVDHDLRSLLLTRCADLQILSAYDCRKTRTLAVSAKQLREAKELSLLFGFSQGRNPEERRGFASEYQRVLAQQSVLLVNAQTCNLVLGQTMKPCKGDAILESLGRKPHVLGCTKSRSALASLVGAPIDAISKKGFRYLLHAKPEYFEADDTLWLLGYQQKPVWQKLWVVMNEGDQSPWSLIETTVADSIPRGLWSDLNIREIKAEAIQQELAEHELASRLDTESFTQQECADLLADIQDDDLWKLLPFHWSCHGFPVSASGDDIYLSDDNSLDSELLENIHLIKSSADLSEQRRQQRMLKPLNDIGMLGVLLASSEPVTYWQDILTIMSRNQLGHDEPLQLRLSRTAWLPAKSGDVFKPEQLIDLADRLDELDQLYALVPEKFCLPHQLLADVLEHQAFNDYCRPLFSRGQMGLVQLAEVLNNQPSYHVGSLAISQPEGLGRIASALATSSFPGWQLLARLAETLEIEDLYQKLWPAMKHSLGLPRQLQMLTWLAENGQSGRAEVDAFNAYLEVFSREAEAEAHLIDLLLLNKSRCWVPADQLVAGVEGIAPAHVLDDYQARLLANLINEDVRPASRSVSEAAPSTSLMPNATGNILRNYFEAWSGRVLDPLVASLIVLLGREDSTRELASDCLRPHSLDWLIGQLPWQVPDTPRDQESKTWLHGFQLEQALAHFSVAINVHNESETTVQSVLGNTIKVSLDEDFESLFIGKPSYYSQGSKGYLISLVLRKIDPASYSDAELSDYIKCSVRYLLKSLYGQSKPILDGLWTELDKSDQVDIELARALILDNIPFYLKQLGAHKHPELDLRLQAYDDARKQVAEFKGNPKEEEFKVKQERLLVDLQQLLESNASVQKSVLEAIRTKVRDYQYQAWSIPFEVFQNADDAVHNLEEIEAWPAKPSDVEPLPPALLKFVVHIEPDRVTFMHWGRAINQIGSGTFPGKKRKFDNDLENMVILSASDKGDDVTGKFGLGFKSVLLVSDTPEIISGRLHARVMGGLLPSAWEDTKYVQGLLRKNQTQKQRGTAISLPLREGVDIKFMESFMLRAGVLAAFSKKIREVDVHQPNGTSLQVRWMPEIFADCEGAAIGKVQLGLGATQRVMKLDLGNGALLLAIDAMGFTELSSELPNIWVTAPISESDHLGYAINGSFEIDAGRSRLAAESDINRALGLKLGDVVERKITQLLAIDWPLLQAQLQLSESTTAYQFWYSLWKTMLGKLPRIANDSGVRVIAQPLATAALGRLAGSRNFVPNGLPSSLGRLLKWQEVKYIFKGVLAQPDLLKALGETDLFGGHIKTNNAIAEEVATWLRLVVPEFKKINDQWVSLGFADLLSKVSFKEGVSQHDASILGKVLNQQARDSLLEGGKALLDDFDTSVKQLEKLKFQSRAGSWLPANELLTSMGTEDEVRRCGFAPATHILASSYDDVAVSFFKLCRRGMEARAEVLVAWLLEAATDQKQGAALRYLLEGDLCNGVARHLLDGDLSGTWVSEVDDDSPLLSDWSYTDKRELLYKVLVTSKDIKTLIFESGNEPDDFEPIDPAIALNKIYHWWQQEQEEQLDEYSSSVYPRETQMILDDDEEGRFDRSSWLSLLLLGGFHTLGRTKPEQHRSFIEDCQRRDWWRIFSDEKPELRFQEWMNVLEEFISAQVDSQQYELWMMRFPVIYKLSRYLDDYTELFIGLDRYEAPFKLSTVLSSRVDEAQQGGGISAPAVGKSLGIGSNFVIRELLRHQILKSSYLFEHAFVPYKRVCDLLRDMGCTGLDPYASIENSPRIYQFISQHLDEKNVSFDNAWDIPLMMVADDWSLQQELLGREMTDWDEVGGE